MIIDAIDNMQRNQFIKVIEKHNEKNKLFLLKSTSKPLIDYCINKIRSRAETSPKKDYPIPTRVDEIIFDKIFDSNWFRNLMATNLLIMYGGQIQRDAKGILKIYNVMKVLADFFEVIATISYTFSLRKETKKLMPTTNDFNLTQSFDDFADEWIKSHLNNLFIDSFLEEKFSMAKKYLGDYETTKVLFNSLLADKKFLCIPYDFSFKMMRIERIQLTYFIAFTQDLPIHY